MSKISCKTSSNFKSLSGKTEMINTKYRAYENKFLKYLAPIFTDNTFASVENSDENFHSMSWVLIFYLAQEVSYTRRDSNNPSGT